VVGGLVMGLGDFTVRLETNGTCGESQGGPERLGEAHCQKESLAKWEDYALLVLPGALGVAKKKKKSSTKRGASA